MYDDKAANENVMKAGARVLEQKNKEIADLKRELESYKKIYHELIMVVSEKYPNETRHQTALRYITEHEARQHESSEAKREGVKHEDT